MRRNFFCIIAASVCFMVLLTSCVFTPQKLELSPEETHKLCETYADDVKWASNFFEQTSYWPLKGLLSSLENTNGFILCSLEVTAADIDTSEEHEDDYTFIYLTMIIKEVYIGDSSVTGKEFTQLVYQKDICEDVSNLVGNIYVDFVLGPNYFFYTPWSFLVTDDDTLVSPFGCQVEEAEEVAAGNLSMDCRNYTGQKLDYFISVVKELEAEIDAETSS